MKASELIKHLANAIDQTGFDPIVTIFNDRADDFLEVDSCQIRDGKYQSSSMETVEETFIEVQS